MSRIAITFGSLLVLLGIVSFLATGSVHPTALIPAFFGLPIAILGLVAQKPSLRMHAMHGAAVLGTLGFIGSLVMVVITLVRLAAGQPMARPVAFWCQLIMIIISGAFVALCVRSFIDARRKGPGFPVITDAK